jgi:hypothetical protein
VLNRRFQGFKRHAADVANRPVLTPKGCMPLPVNMTLLRMDNVGIVLDGLAAAVAFFTELGLELEGEAQVEGGWVDRVVGLNGVRVRAWIAPGDAVYA